MSDVWRQCEGQVIDNRFRLQRYLGGTDDSAVFLTQLAGSPFTKSRHQIYSRRHQRRSSSSHFGAASYSSLILICSASWTSAAAALRTGIVSTS